MFLFTTLLTIVLVPSGACVTISQTISIFALSGAISGPNASPLALRPVSHLRHRVVGSVRRDGCNSTRFAKSIVTVLPKISSRARTSSQAFHLQRNAGGDGLRRHTSRAGVCSGSRRPHLSALR